MDEILASILTPQQLALAQQNAQQNALLSLGFGLLGASQGQVGQPRPSFGQILGQVGPQAIQAYQGGIDQTLQNILRSQQLKEAQRKAALPTFMTVKTPDGGEEIVQVSPTGVLSRADIPGLGGGVASPKFDAPTNAFIQFKYPGKSYTQLTPDQQKDVIEFANAPDATKRAELDRESKKAKFETGVDVTVPRGRESFLQNQLLAPPSQVAPKSQVAPTSAVTPTVSPVVSPIAQIQPVSAIPVSQETPTRVSEASAIKIPADLAKKPLGENEKPLIESSAITPKAKQELEIAKPKQTQAVEYVLETSGQMLSVIDEILKNPALDDAFGPGGKLMSQLGLFPNAARIGSLLERLGGNLFIEAITAMRAASATGAAVGNATEKEGDKLQSSRAAIQQIQSSEDARRELESLRDTLLFQQNLVKNAYERTYGKGSFVQRTPQKAPEQRKPLEEIFKGR